LQEDGTGSGWSQFSGVPVLVVPHLLRLSFAQRSHDQGFVMRIAFAAVASVLLVAPAVAQIGGINLLDNNERLKTGRRQSMTTPTNQF
jgi:hypothetical protein